MSTTRDDLQIARSHLVAARNLTEQAASQLRHAYAFVRPECMPPRHWVDQRLQEFARRIGHGIEEIEERLAEGVHA